MATSYNIDYNDEKFQQVESDKQAALSEVENTYNNMIGQSDQFYQDQINAAKDYATQQQQIQQQEHWMQSLMQCQGQCLPLHWLLLLRDPEH